MIVGGRSPVRVAVIISLLFLFQQLKKRCAHGGSSPLVLETWRDLGFFGKRGERDRERSPACHCSFDPKAAGWPASAPISSLFLLAFFLLAFLLAAAVTVSSLCASHCHTSVSEIMTLSCFESFPLPFYFVQRWYRN